MHMQRQWVFSLQSYPENVLHFRNVPISVISSPISEVLFLLRCNERRNSNRESGFDLKRIHLEWYLRTVFHGKQGGYVRCYSLGDWLMTTLPRTFKMTD